MNILFLTLYNFKSLEDKNIYPDLMRKFVKEKHNVYIVCPSERRNKEKTHAIEEGYTLLRVKTLNMIKVNMVEKALGTLLIEKQFKKAIIKYFQNIKFDLVLYSTPPITFAKVVRYIKNRDCAKTYLLLKDIFPQNAVDLGMFSKRSLVYKFFRRKEKKLYQISDAIGCMSQRNIDYLLSHNRYLDKEKVHVSPNTIEPVKIEKKQEMRDSIRKKYGIPLDKLIFIYGGNLGKPQGIDFLIKCLKLEKDNDKIFFLIVGSGTEYLKLEKFSVENKLKNFKLLSFLPKDDYDTLVNTCDIGLIFLDKRFTIPNFPSRLLAYMQASMPVLACTDKNTDIGKVIVDGEFGWWCESSEAEDFKKVLDEIVNDPLEIMTKGNNAREYLERHYTVGQSYEIIMSCLK